LRPVRNGMMKKTLILFLLLLSSATFAQTIPANTQAVIDAENAFAGLSKQQNTREAFITHLDENSIVFSQGEPVKGQALWKQRAVGKSLLFWWPVFADAAASGDFGYTTGPFEVSLDRANPVPSVFGYYSTVWKKNEKGEWKVVIDMGITFPSKEKSYSELSVGASAAKGNAKEIASESDLLLINKNYDAVLSASGKSFEVITLATQARVHRTGAWPYTTVDAISGSDKNDRTYSFENLGGGVASSGDMGFTYGKVSRVIAKDGKTETEKLNYLRVWKREEGKWKIALDVIGG
jgi:ketosteroid isomerase-like protein